MQNMRSIIDCSRNPLEERRMPNDLTFTHPLILSIREPRKFRLQGQKPNSSGSGRQSKSDRKDCNNCEDETEDRTIAQAENIRMMKRSERLVKMCKVLNQFHISNLPNESNNSNSQ